MPCAGECGGVAAALGTSGLDLDPPCQGFTPILSAETGQSVVRGIVAFEGYNSGARLTAGSQAVAVYGRRRCMKPYCAYADPAPTCFMRVMSIMLCLLRCASV